MNKLKNILIFCVFVYLSIYPTFALYTDDQTVTPKITQYNPNRDYSVVSRPPSEATLLSNIDGVPVKVEIPGVNSEVIRVTVFDGSSIDKVWYDYDLNTKNITMNWINGSRTYDPDKEEDFYGYFSMIKIMDDLTRTAFAQSGISYDMASKQLTISQQAYVNKIDPNIQVETYTVDDVVNIKLTKGLDVMTCSYDTTSGLATIPKDIIFASNYQYDYSGGVSVASVQAQGGLVDNTANLVTSPFALIFSAYHLGDQFSTISKDINTQLQPMARLEDPELSDIDWLNKQQGLITIKGKAKVVKSSELSIYVNNYKITDAISWLGEDWSVVNYSKPVGNGENKVNVIIRRDDGREAESGDVTVYKGSAGKPDLILLSPRDRQIISNHNITKSIYEDENVNVKGQIFPNSIVTISGKSVEVDATGKFNTFKSIRICEGNNAIPVEVMSSSKVLVDKNVLGAYEFNVNGKSQAYILRKGDFAFNLMALSFGLTMFNPVPFSPDHTGIYIGNKTMAECDMKNGVATSPIESWNNSGFAGATQVPKLINEAMREKVVQKILTKTDKGYKYDIPISIARENLFRFSLKGHYDGPGNDNKLYCSELAYWAWDETAKENNFTFGVSLGSLLYPDRGSSDVANNSVLPAFLYQKTMEVRRKDK